MNGSLSCSAVNCVHNLTGLCSANRILVNGMSAQSSAGTLCSTFAERTLKNAVSNMMNMNLPGEIKQLFHNDKIYMYPAIDCNAVRCQYNKDRRCDAGKVIIMGAHAMDSEDTYCETFAP